jgi:mxaJ protein
MMVSIMSRVKQLRPILGGTLVLLSCSAISCAAPLPAPSPAADNATLRVCASANQPPFSEQDGSGFENKVAWAVAQAMGRQLQYVWSDKPAIFLVQDSLDKNDCDVIIGLDTGDSRVLTTKPYYRTGYVFLTRADRNLDIHSWSDPRVKGLKKIAVEFGSPGEQMLKAIGKYDDEFNYEKSLVNFRSNRNELGGYLQISPTRIISEVASGNADMGVAFAPDVARYVRESPVPLRMTLVDDDTVKSNGEKIPERFDQSMGVRKDDPNLKAELDSALVKARPDIQAILKDEGIPLLEPHS